MAALIDPEELPFTPDEIYAAASTFLPAATAREMADRLVEVGPALVEGAAGATSELGTWWGCKRVQTAAVWLGISGRVVTSSG